jgi:hypothetical protein
MDVGIVDWIKLSLRSRVGDGRRPRASRPRYHLYGESAEGIRLPSDPVAANELADAVLENYFASLRGKPA